MGRQIPSFSRWPCSVRPGRQIPSFTGFRRLRNDLRNDTGPLWTVGKSRRSSAVPVPEDRVGKSHLWRDPSNSCLIPTQTGRSPRRGRRRQSGAKPTGFVQSVSDGIQGLHGNGRSSDSPVRNWPTKPVRRLHAPGHLAIVEALARLGLRGACDRVQGQQVVFVRVCGAGSRFVSSQPASRDRVEGEPYRACQSGC